MKLVCLELSMPSTCHPHSTKSLEKHLFDIKCRMSSSGIGALNPSKLTKNLLYPRRTKLPPDPGVNLFLKKKKEKETAGDDSSGGHAACDDGDGHGDDVGNENVVWESDEIETISSLFKSTVLPKGGRVKNRRYFSLPLPHKVKSGGPLTLRKEARSRCSRVGLLAPSSSARKRLHKNPSFLIGLAREITKLGDGGGMVSSFMDKWAHVIRRGSLSLTIKELGIMGHGDKALQVFSWVMNQRHRSNLFPDERVLASIVEVVATTGGGLSDPPFVLEKFSNLASQSAIEALARGLIRNGNLRKAIELMKVAEGRRGLRLDPSIHVKLIRLERSGEGPTSALMDALGAREELVLRPKEMIDLMEACVRMGRYGTVEALFRWAEQVGHERTTVMYTAVVRSRCCEKRYREAAALVWEMEDLKLVFDLPAYTAIIKLFSDLNDLQSCGRHFSSMKESGFTPTYDIYRAVIRMYIDHGRLGRCKRIRAEIQTAGYTLDEDTKSLFLHLESGEPLIESTSIA